MSGVIGLNILGQYVANSAALISFARRLNPAAFLVMDSLALYNALALALPNATAVYRAYHPLDAEVFIHWTPERWLAEFGHLAPGGYVQVGNEPNGYVNTERQVAWFVELARQARRAGKRLGLCAYGVGHPSEAAIMAGAFDPLIRELADGYHILILHEYGKDSTRAERPHHIGRFAYWRDRARAIGVNAPRIVIGEYGRDNVAPGQGGGLHDGWRGTGWTEAQYADFLGGAAELYANAGIATCIFCYGSGAGGSWQSFNIEGAATLQERLIELNAVYPVKSVSAPPAAKPKPTGWGEPIRVKVAPGMTINVRSAPTITAATQIGQVKQGDEVLFLKPPPNEPKIGDYLWGWVEKGTLKGWIALVTDVWLPEGGKANQFVPVGAAPVVIKRISVPYVSQSLVGSLLKKNDCGIACALMLDRYLEVKAGRSAPSIPVVDDLVRYAPELLTDKPVAVSTILDVLRKRGIAANVRRPLSMDAIKAELDTDRPVMMLVSYRYIVPSDPFDGGHFVVVIGYTDQGVIVHDPYNGGADLHLSYAQFELAISQTGGAGLPYQGIVLAA